ncbi:hypothetical protein R3W88_033085 [Solanum pinnatisectum]|uniref:Prolamin-like domain-containing protein n=1 Tax=Solanum pinnatisectum TaxID=50273 RepID=A0AAV9K2F8_9SOLN|nr:hypothetical protein R3W88_033085 [Solanum pinnatisectum]
MSRSLRSATLLCLFLLLDICIGIVTSTATEPKTESFGTSSIGLWPRWWWRTHPKISSPPTGSPSPSPIDNVASPTHMTPSPVDDVVSPPQRLLLSTISNDCFYREYTHSKRVPFFLGKLRNYCSHAVDNAAPSLSPVDNAASPTHVAPSPVADTTSPTHASPSPSPAADAASPTHAAPSPVADVVSHMAPSPIDDVVSPSHMALSWGPGLAPTTSCTKVDGCAFNLITSVSKRKITLSTQCCEVLSTISDDCFYREFTHSKRHHFS